MLKYCKVLWVPLLVPEEIINSFESDHLVDKKKSGEKKYVSKREAALRINYFLEDTKKIIGFLHNIWSFQKRAFKVLKNHVLGMDYICPLLCILSCIWFIMYMSFFEMTVLPTLIFLFFRKTKEAMQCIRYANLLYAVSDYGNIIHRNDWCFS